MQIFVLFFESLVICVPTWWKEEDVKRLFEHEFLKEETNHINANLQQQTFGMSFLVLDLCRTWWEVTLSCISLVGDCYFSLSFVINFCFPTLSVTDIRGLIPGSAAHILFIPTTTLWSIEHRIRRIFWYRMLKRESDHWHLVQGLWRVRFYLCSSYNLNHYG